MKKKQVVAYIVIVLMFLSTSVFAATISGNMNLTSSDNSVSAGDEFNVTLSLEDISTPAGVDSVSGYISIDENILEDLTVQSIVTNEDGQVEIDSNNILNIYEASEDGANGETGVTFNPNPDATKGDYKILIDLEDGITEDTDLLTITFKVKEGVQPGTYEDAISYTLFDIFSGTTDKGTLTDKSLDITVEEVNNNPGTDDPNDVPNDEPNNNTVNDNNVGDNENNSNNNNNQGNNSNNNNSGNNPTNGNSNRNEAQGNGGTNNQSDNTTASGSLPNTGYKFIILPIIAIAIAGIIFYRKYKKYSKF